jgi:hypothetical protein
MGSDLGHDLLGTADPRRPAAFAAGATLAAGGSARRPDGDLVPGDLLIHGDGHGSPPIGSVMAEPTHVGKRPPNRALRARQAVPRGRLVTPRHAGADHTLFHRCRRRRKGRDGPSHDVLGAGQALELLHGDLGQPDPSRQLVGDQLRSGPRSQDLATPGKGAQPSRPIQRLPVVVALAQLGLPVCSAIGWAGPSRLARLRPSMPATSRRR